MEFLQHFRGIQMDTLPVKMAVEFKNIAHFWKYAADENTFSWKRKLYQKSWGSSAVEYLLSVLRWNPQNIFLFLREQLDRHDQIMKSITTKLSTNLYK